jgi:hypothetical protein
MSDSGASAEAGDMGGGTSLFYSLAVFYLLISVFIIIVAWIVPSIVLSASVTFTLLGSIIFISSIIQLVYTADLAATLCGKCPPPAPS